MIDSLLALASEEPSAESVQLSAKSNSKLQQSVLVLLV